MPGEIRALLAGGFPASKTLAGSERIRPEKPAVTGGARLFVLIAFSVYLGMNWYVLARLFHLFGLAKNSWFYAGAFLNVSAGTGIWRPPMRLGSHSEIVLREPMP